MELRLSRSETVLLALVATLAATALLGPAIVQPASYHDFADARTLWGVPHAMDVLSNAVFALMALAGMGLLALATPRLGNMERGMSWLFFGGLLVTSVVSSWYHLHPGDGGLAMDRIGMAIAFAGLLGLGAASRVSERAGALLGLGTLVLAPLTVFHWARTGDVFPWAVLQAGGVAIILLYATLQFQRSMLDVRWTWVIAAYSLAKVFELNDQAVFELTAHAVSGHTMKHVLAALAAWPVVAALKNRGFSRQNALSYFEDKSMTADDASDA